MSWVNELVDLYEKNDDKIGVIEYRRDMPYVLLPPFHTTVTAQIVVTIDQSGNFMNAELVNANDKLTIIPVTEKSGSRTAGKEPHPLCDNLRYLAGIIRSIIKMTEFVMNCIFPNLKNGLIPITAMRKFGQFICI